MLDLLLFTIGIVLYLGVIIFMVKFHKSVNLRFGWPNPNGIGNIIICYLIFALFVITVIPLSIFFPLWLNAAFPVLQDTVTTRVILLLFGCFVLSYVMWAIYKHEKLRY